MAKVQTWVLQHPWIFDLVRGVFSLLLGLGAFLFRDRIVVILSLGIGFYLIVDGVMDIITSYRAAHHERATCFDITREMTSFRHEGR